MVEPNHDCWVNHLSLNWSKPHPPELLDPTLEAPSPKPNRDDGAIRTDHESTTTWDAWRQQGRWRQGMDP